MNKTFHVAGPELWEEIEQLPNDQHPAIVFNSHITGLAVARNLGKEGIPVIALDRDGRAYGLQSKYANIAAYCPNPLVDEDGFIQLLIDIGKRLPKKGVLFPSNDEWVFAVLRNQDQLNAYYFIPFSELETVERILNKRTLYKESERLGIPIPKTWYPEEDELTHVPFPCIVKPVEQRSFYDAFQVKVFEVHSQDELTDVLKKTNGHEVVIQEVIGESLSDFYSLCSYVSPKGEAKGVFVGQKLEQYPLSFGTGCLVRSAYRQEIVDAGIHILHTLGYHGISEAEFIYDKRDQTYKLLDLNTRTWKWIGLPVAAGIPLPLLSYLEAIGKEAPTYGRQKEPLKWVYFHDYYRLKQEGGSGGTTGHLTDDELSAIVRGQLPTETLVDAVFDRDDSDPGVQLIKNGYGDQYVCPC
ncbi:hypothetical protein [Priestia koreensis]|uniref:carboxylate--amine ligase n=1 Tax=Priestia koreensis TaxID=284581 RepID=UPI00203D3663|nr:hypothetical protein [Priestia koreensis]MCM3006969.1 hypothetical protein [Priestia koreensis]